MALQSTEKPDNPRATTGRPTVEVPTKRDNDAALALSQTYSTTARARGMSRWPKPLKFK